MDIENSKPQETPAPATEAAPAVAPTPAPVAAPTGMAPQTKGNAAGGWNRFAGYKPGEGKNKQKDKDRRDSRGRR